MAIAPRCIAALDQGTTSTRCILFNERGEVLSLAQREHAQHYPQPGWVEHDAMEIWRNAQNVVADALAGAGLAASHVAALGITNQRETTVLWNRLTGEPVHRALVWQDTRVDALVQEYTHGGSADRIRALTGLPLASYFSALKLQWLLDHVPGASEQATHGELLFGTIDSWLTWQLTGGASGGMHVTDVTNASRTQLMNLTTLDWDDELLDAFLIPRAVLPRIVSSSEIVGTGRSGALAGVPIAGMLGDQQAALVGQTCFAPGEAKNTYGTGCFLLMNTGERIVASQAGLITTVAYRFGKERAAYALEGSIAVAGALVQWLRDSLKILSSSNEVEALAREVAGNGGVYFVPAFSGLYAPHWNAGARGRARAHGLCHTSAHRASCTRSHGISNARGARSHAARCQHRARRSARGWRHGGE
jgi:glycerol kinase